MEKYDAELIANPKQWALDRQESIVEYYLGIKIGPKLIRSPFRDDKKPTCGFYYSKSRRLYFHDFATEEHLDCFEIVKRKFNLTYKEAVDKIIQDKERFSLSDRVEKEDSLIEFVIGDKSNLSYFHKFGISNQTLEKFRVYPAKTVYRNQKIIAKNKREDPLFVYLYASGRMKIYRPYNKEHKWGGNATGGDVQGLEHLPRYGQLLFITSSLKDVMCLRELGYNAIAFNGEGYGVGEGKTSKVVESTIRKLQSRFEHIVFYLDNDEPGIRFAEKLSKKFRLKYVYNPLNSPKDISDYVKDKTIYNGKRRIKKLLSKTFKVQSGFLDYVEHLNSTNYLNDGITWDSNYPLLPVE